MNLSMNDINKILSALAVACICTQSHAEANSGKRSCGGRVPCPLVDLAERENAEIAETGVSCAARGRQMYSDSLADASLWGKPQCHGNKIRVSFGDAGPDGRPCMSVTGIADSKADTAWCVVGLKREFVRQADEFLWKMEVDTPKEIPSIRSHGDKWRTSIHWYAASGEELPQSMVNYSVSTGGFHCIRARGKIPVGAAAFALHMGFDGPNVDPGETIRFRNLEISQLSALPLREPCARVTSYPLEGGRVSWKCRKPAGTRVRFQYAGAKTAEALRTAKFRGPDGTDATFFDAHFDAKAPFVRYRAFLYSAGPETPVLESVTVGSRTDGAWADRPDRFPPTVNIVSPSPTRDVHMRPELNVQDPSTVAWGTLAVRVDGHDETASFVRDGSRLRYAGRSEPWSDGLHEIEVSVADWCGNAVVSRKTFFIGDAPAATRTTLRDDGVTLVDGKPFFPIGIYGFKPCEANGNNLERGLLELKAAGFNLVQSYTRPIRAELLALCEKHGMMVFRGPRWPDRESIEKVRHSPALLAWYLGDDTSEHMTPGRLLDEHEAMKSIDPHRLSCQADGGSSHLPVTSYYDYQEGTDVFLPEIYPIYVDTDEDKDMCVATVIDTMERFRHDVEMRRMGPRSMWPILQYFQGWTNWKRFPTRDELFATSFAALVHGAHGITWYTYFGGPSKHGSGFNYGAVSTPERKSIMFELSRRIAELAPVLLERTPVEQPVPEVLNGVARDVYNRPSVTCLLKRHAGNAYLLAVNAVRTPVRVRIPISGVAPAGEVLWEGGRRVSFADGALEEDFGPQAVHVYRFACR